MLDTIAATFPLELTDDELKSWPEMHVNERPKQRFVTYCLYVIVDATTLTARYNPPNSVYPAPRLKLEISLPTVLYGSNVSQFEDIAEVHAAALIVNSMIAHHPGLPHVDIRDGTLARVDLCFNHQVGGHVQDYLNVLRKAEYPQRQRRAYADDGVQFGAGMVCTKFYDKQAECHRQDARGILRQETTIRRFYIGRLMHQSSPTLRDITPEWVADILQKDLHTLHLDEQKVYPRDTAHDILVHKYGVNTGDRLFGFINAYQSMNTTQLLSMGYRESAIGRNKRLIAEAGIAIGYAQDDDVLPALRIAWSEGENVKRCIK